jgi:SAM-dependent methyltransferase
MNTIAETQAPAEVYDTSFVPALFGKWGPVVAAEAQMSRGDRVLDVACGTGALTLAAAEIAGPAGSVVGLDANPEMLAVARRKPEQIEWLEGKAEALPFPDNEFDAVVSQFGLMFFQDKPRALGEMMRVLKPGGRLAVAVFAKIEDSPGYDAFAQLLDRLFGTEVGDALRTPFVLGDAGLLKDICRKAGIGDVRIERHNAKVRFGSVDALVSIEHSCVWTLGGVLTDEQFDRLLEEADTALQPYLVEGGHIEFDMPALIITARKA